MDRWCLVISVSVNCLFPSLFEMFLAPNDIQILQRVAYPATTSEKCMVQVHIDLDWPTNSPIHDFKYSNIPGLCHQNDGKGKHTQNYRMEWLSLVKYLDQRGIHPENHLQFLHSERPLCWLKQRLVNGPVWGFWHRPWSRSLQFGGHSHEPTWKLMINIIYNNFDYMIATSCHQIPHKPGVLQVFKWYTQKQQHFELCQLNSMEHSHEVHHVWSPARIEP